MVEVTTGLSFRQSVDHMVDRALALIEIDPGIAKAIKTCTSVLQVSFPVEIRGKVEVFTGCPPRAACATPNPSTSTRWRRWRR